MSIYEEAAPSLLEPFMGVFGFLGGCSMVVLIVVGSTALMQSRRERPHNRHWFFAFAHLQLLFFLFIVVISNAFIVYPSSGPLHHIYAGHMVENSMVLLIDLLLCLLFGWAIAKRHSVRPAIGWLSSGCVLIILVEAFFLWSALVFVVSLRG